MFQLAETIGKSARRRRDNDEPYVMKNEKL